jgi:hypothetical protein
MACRDCAHLRRFELCDEIKTCPVLNIRIHTETAETFWCSLFTAHQEKEMIAMDAFKCDRCGTLSEGRPEWGARKSVRIPAEGWPRKMDAVDVVVLIQPVNDPTGYGGMALCSGCKSLLVAQALDEAQEATTSNG